MRSKICSGIANEADGMDIVSSDVVTMVIDVSDSVDLDIVDVVSDVFFVDPGDTAGFLVGLLDAVADSLFFFSFLSSGYTPAMTSFKAHPELVRPTCAK